MSDPLVAAIMAMTFFLPTIAAALLAMSLLGLESSVGSWKKATTCLVASAVSALLVLASIGAFAGLAVMCTQQLDLDGFLLFCYLLVGVFFNGFCIAIMYSFVFGSEL